MWIVWFTPSKFSVYAQTIHSLEKAVFDIREIFVFFRFGSFAIFTKVEYRDLEHCKVGNIECSDLSIFLPISNVVTCKRYRARASRS